MKQPSLQRRRHDTVTARRSSKVSQPNHLFLNGRNDADLHEVLVPHAGDDGKRKNTQLRKWTGRLDRGTKDGAASAGVNSNHRHTELTRRHFLGERTLQTFGIDHREIATNTDQPASRQGRARVRRLRISTVAPSICYFKIKS